MRSVHAIMLCGLLATTTAAAGGSAQDPLAPCARIDEIRVPDELHVDADLVVYAPSSAPRLTVTRQRIELGGRRFEDPTVGPYHAALQAFLTQSRSMAAVTRTMLNRGRYAQVASARCRRVLELRAAGLAVEQRFPGFVSPVRIRLK
ncbi:hypothetical protein [Agrilutibacter solisilvae]|uniref:SPOR domain-containing protein n=1 Tax=Agrilutibacter solisilvae TaxID=2763317 RepID=A0A974XXZ9_9GAMM|nr:hypothetical protein [Lysobacter solisilvae]QSX77852.1 hypothetical protein I8J32_014145 [Lysobacter solisilvae]